MDRNTEALVAAILTIAKFLPNVTYASETVATEFQQNAGGGTQDRTQSGPRRGAAGQGDGEAVGPSHQLHYVG